MEEQTITVVLKLNAGQPPYRLMEQRGTYEALRSFFEDIGYTVKEITGAEL